MLAKHPERRSSDTPNGRSKEEAKAGFGVARDILLNCAAFPSLAFVLVVGLHPLFTVTLSRDGLLRKLASQRLQKGVQTLIGISYLAKTCWTSDLTG